MPDEPGTATGDATLRSSSGTLAETSEKETYGKIAVEIDSGHLNLYKSGRTKATTQTPTQFAHSGDHLASGATAPPSAGTLLRNGPGGDKAADPSLFWLLAALVTVAIALILPFAIGTGSVQTKTEATSPVDQPNAILAGPTIDQRVNDYAARYVIRPAGAGDGAELGRVISDGATLVFEYFLTADEHEQSYANRLASNEELRKRMTEVMCSDAARRELLNDGAHMRVILRRSRIPDLEANVITLTDCNKQPEPNQAAEAPLGGPSAAPSTARPVTGGGGFDPSTAVPYTPPRGANQESVGREEPVSVIASSKPSSTRTTRPPGLAHPESDTRGTAPQPPRYASFMESVKNGTADDVEWMVRNGADVNMRIGGTTPIIEAARVSNVAVAAVLLEAGADPNRVGADSYTALDHAQKRGDMALVTLLKAHGAVPASAQAKSKPEPVRRGANQATTDPDPGPNAGTQELLAWAARHYPYLQNENAPQMQAVVAWQQAYMRHTEEPNIALHNGISMVTRGIERGDGTCWPKELTAEQLASVPADRRNNPNYILLAKHCEGTQSSVHIPAQQVLRDTPWFAGGR